MKSKQIKSIQGKNHRFLINDKRHFKTPTKQRLYIFCRHIVGDEQPQETAMEQELAMKE